MRTDKKENLMNFWSSSDIDLKYKINYNRKHSEKHIIFFKSQLVLQIPACHSIMSTISKLNDVHIPQANCGTELCLFVHYKKIVCFSLNL